VELVDEIAATEEDVQQAGVMAALTTVAVVIAIASLSPSLALCEEEQQREASTHCVSKQTKQQQPWRAHLSPIRVSGIRVLGRATDQK
jgi:hypothetical protein